MVTVTVANTVVVPTVASTFTTPPARPVGVKRPFESTVPTFGLVECQVTLPASAPFTVNCVLCAGPLAGLTVTCNVEGVMEMPLALLPPPSGFGLKHTPVQPPASFVLPPFPLGFVASFELEHAPAMPAAPRPVIR